MISDDWTWLSWTETPPHGESRSSGPWGQSVHKQPISTCRRMYIIGIYTVYIQNGTYAVAQMKCVNVVSINMYIPLKCLVAVGWR